MAVAHALQPFTGEGSGEGSLFGVLFRTFRLLFLIRSVTIFAVFRLH
ncbi:hypothetical protein [Bradyrhizobium cajani]|uniref:Uncharacterized protein n=1 Tax=Bradyrhizobium cajani TaxID=1928661 RepID=A0A844TCC9_9BRAD|nr:hypothetical protein [Bradyrhizobium cajani]MCP3368178.1 hypothetical protein [Bradyrhizobium cajani]MVT76727.1 hypothetical protein [Bradyrhizobium cajani]